MANDRIWPEQPLKVPLHPIVFQPWNGGPRPVLKAEIAQLSGFPKCTFWSAKADA
jgi:hypothetical protein